MPNFIKTVLAGIVALTLWLFIVVFALFVFFMVKAHADEPYVSLGAGGVKSLQTSNDDRTEFSTDPWFQTNVAVGDNRITSLGPVNMGGEIEADIVPSMPLHGHNTGKGDANHRTADGQSITMGSLMANVEPQVHLWDGARAYIVSGAGLGEADGAGLAYQAGVGLKQDITSNLLADASFRYRNINGIELLGPELRIAWTFNSPFGLGSKGADEK